LNYYYIFSLISVQLIIKIKDVHSFKLNNSFSYIPFPFISKLCFLSIGSLEKEIEQNIWPPLVALPSPRPRKAGKEKLLPPGHQAPQKYTACVHQQRIKGRSVASFIGQVHRLG